MEVTTCLEKERQCRTGNDCIIIYPHSHKIKGKAKEREKKEKKEGRRYSVVIKGGYSVRVTTFSFLIQERSSGEGDPTILRIWLS